MEQIFICGSFIKPPCHNKYCSRNMFLRTMDSIITAKTSDTQISRGFHRFPSPVIIFPRIESSSMPTPTLIQSPQKGRDGQRWGMTDSCGNQQMHMRVLMMQLVTSSAQFYKIKIQVTYSSCWSNAKPDSSRPVVGVTWCGE